MQVATSIVEKVGQVIIMRSETIPSKERDGWRLTELQLLDGIAPEAFIGGCTAPWSREAVDWSVLQFSLKEPAEAEGWADAQYGAWSAVYDWPGLQRVLSTRAFMGVE